MAKSVRVDYVVSGEGEFPVDMLRYDQSTPNSESDSQLIGHTDRHREVALTCITEIKYWLPAWGRWDSFGWNVIKVTSPSFTSDQLDEFVKTGSSRHSVYIRGKN